MIEINDISLGYSGRHDVIRSVSTRIGKGELAAIIGPNGSGKSTLLKAVAGNLRLHRGEIRLEGRTIGQYSPKALARQIAFLPQAPSAPDDYTVEDLVGYGRFPHLGWTGRMGEADREIVQEAIALTHLTDLAHRPVSRLSGGERQRAWIAMALAQKPRLLLLDEPTTHLDISFQYEVLELVKDLNTRLSITTLVVLHDLNQAARFADRIIGLKKGRMVLNGRPKEVFRRDTVEGIFDIVVGMEQDTFNNCPLLIPIRSRRQLSTGTTG